MKLEIIQLLHRSTKLNFFLHTCNKLLYSERAARSIRIFDKNANIYLDIQDAKIKPGYKFDLRHLLISE
mgnify:CR=1 FL=1